MNIPPDSSCHFHHPNSDSVRMERQQQQKLVMEKVGDDVTVKSIEDTLLAEKLMDAVQDKHYGLCQVLLCLRARGDLVCDEKGGMAPIHLAVGLEPLGDSLDFLRLLLQYGANPNVRATCDGITPVHLSAILQKPKAMKLLLASGGDPDILDQDEKSAFHHGWDCEKIRRILQKYLKEQQSSSSSNSSSDCSSSDMDMDPKFSPVVAPKKKVRRPLMALDVNQKPNYGTDLDVPRTRRPATSDQEAQKCDLCVSLKRRRHFDKMMLKSMGVHFSKYHSVKLAESQNSRQQIVSNQCQRCFCSEKRMNFSYPLERKLKLWYECNAGKESFMKNLVKSLPAVSPTNLMKHKRPSTKVEAVEKICRRFSSGQTNIYQEITGSNSKAKAEASSSGSENEPISSNESLSSQNSNSGSTCSSIESAKNLLNMQITEKDLDKISLIDGEAVGLKPNAQLDVSSPNNPVIREKKSLSNPNFSEGSCTCRCSNHRRNSGLDVTLAPGRRSLSLSNEKLSKPQLVTKDVSMCCSPLNNQHSKPRKSFTNSPLLLWKKKNNLELEKELLKTPKLLEQNLSLNSGELVNHNLLPIELCVANGMELTPREKVSMPLKYNQKSKYTQCSPHTTNCQSSEPSSDSEFWDTIDSENVKPKSLSHSKRLKFKNVKKTKQRHAHNSTKCNECGSKFNSPVVQRVVEKNCSSKTDQAKSVQAGSFLYRDDFTGGFKTGLEKVSRIDEVTGSSTTSRKTIASGRRVTFSDQASSHYSNPHSSDENNLSPLSNEDLVRSSFSYSRRANDSVRVSPTQFYRSIFNRNNSKRVSNCSKVSSELIREGDFVFEQVFIKPKSEESLMTNDLSNHSFNTSFVTCNDWKSCRTASTRQNSIHSEFQPAVNSSRVEPKEASNNDATNQGTVQEQDSIRVTDNLQQLSNAEIFDRLKSLNCSKYGPVTDTTRSIYLKILAGFQARLDGSFEKLSIESQKESMMAIQTEYSSNPNEFPRLLSDYLMLEERARTGAAASVVTSLPDLEGEEQLMTSLFGDPKRNWREGKRKKCFNYLLLDPRVTKNLQNRSRDLSEIELFGYFVRAIFYVGKGQASRPLSHFNEAVRHTKSDSTSLPEKISHIKDIWESGYGVVNLQCYQNAIPAEAYTREALMIGALGLNRLTNQRKGDCYGVCSTWPDSRRQQLGIYLLKKAMLIFLQDGERQIKPTDF